jgi:serine/threonine-protein kinase
MGMEAQGAVLAPGRVVAGKFRLHAPLGQGGMGTVWLAQHMSLQTPCALKFLQQSVAESPAYRARFEREAIAAAQLRSPNVVNILDHGVWEGVPYIAMELLDGEDLSRRLRRVRILPPRETASIIAQVARALQRAHAAGLVHRDLKPANIFLVRDDDREIAKVLDFGVAKVDTGGESDAITQTGAVLGTPSYMSPEQSQGAKDVDHRSDLWSLGVIAYRCLTGELPFQSEAPGELYMRIIVRPLPVPSRIAPVPPGFDAWWFRAASRDPAMRFQSARELADALAVALGVTAGDITEIGRVGPGFASNPAIVGPPSAPPPAAPPQPVAPPTLSGSAVTPVLAASPHVPKAAPTSRAGLVVALGVTGLAVVAVGAAVALRVLLPSSAPPASASAVPTAVAPLTASAMPRLSPSTPPPVGATAASEPEPSTSAAATVAPADVPVPTLPSQKATVAGPMPRPSATAGTIRKKNPFTDRN